MSFVYFTDRDLGNQFPQILSSAGITVEQHKHHFAQDAPDDEWLAKVSAYGWIVLTRDRRIRYKPNEIAAVRQHKASMIVIIGEAPHSDLAYNFVATLSRIEQFLIQRQPPFIAKLYRPSAGRRGRQANAAGQLEQWYP